MPNFSIRDIKPGRFANDFIVEPNPGYQATDEEKAVLGQFSAATQMLADDQRQDASIARTLAAARQTCRDNAVSRLRTIAQGFVGGAPAADAASQCSALVDEFKTQSPRITISDASPARFTADFVLNAVGYTPDQIEQAYFDRLRRILDAFAEDEQSDASAGFSKARLAARQGRRQDAALHLRDQLTQYLENRLSIEIATDNALVIQGQYIADRNRLARPLFEVFLLTETENGQDFAVDINIKLNPGLPPPEDQPTQEKQELFVQVAGTQTVLAAVCQQIQERAGRRWRSEQAAAERLQAKRLLDEYLRKLAGIAQLGLEGPHPTLAKLALSELRNEFVVQQAPRIKNLYVRRLGTAAAIAAIPLLLLYALIYTRAITSDWWSAHSTFLIAAAGAAIGCWMSFSARRVQLAFNDLAVLEEDLLDPSIRVVFVIALTLAACLLFWTGVMNIEIGNLKTNASAFAKNGTIAMLIGVFCGLSERALATAISGRAATFVRGLGG